jgi:hypothetical protein
MECPRPERFKVNAIAICPGDAKAADKSFLFDDKNLVSSVFQKASKRAAAESGTYDQHFHRD